MIMSSDGRQSITRRGARNQTAILGLIERKRVSTFLRQSTVVFPLQTITIGSERDQGFRYDKRPIMDALVWMQREQDVESVVR